MYAVGRCLALVGLTCLVGCVFGPGRPRIAAPARYELTRANLTLRSEISLEGQSDRVSELSELRLDLARELGVSPAVDPLEVHLFADAKALGTFMRTYYPALPARRAYFIKTDSHLTIYAQWGPHVDEDLRHEVTHGYLQAMVPQLPLWLDEGLAEYFEMPCHAQGINREHLGWLRAQLARDGWRPNLARLEQLPPQSDLTRADYAEAWAWVHFLMQSGPQRLALLQEFLRSLTSGGTAEPLSARLRRSLDSPEVVLCQHLRTLLALQEISGADHPAEQDVLPAAARAAAWETPGDAR